MPATRNKTGKKKKAPAKTGKSAKNGSKAKTRAKSGAKKAGARVEAGEVVRGRKSTKSKAAKGKAAKKSSKAAKTSKKTKSSKTKRVKRERYTAKTADKHLLYQLAVQSPEEDVKFAKRIYRTLRGKNALHYREDFCGTGLLSSHWIAMNKNHTAEGFDIDPEPVAWGLAHNQEPLGEDAARYTVHIKDVREPGHRAPDIRVAQNFSYCVFRERNELLEYFRAAYESLAEDGIFMIDLHGGSEATEEMEEERDCDGFTYVWDQDQYWPGTGEYVCYIHFRFSDGTEIKKAFSYKWRLWFLTELMDVMYDAGFQRVERYFEGTDPDGESGNGVFRRGVRGENCLSWIAYLVGMK